MKKLLILFGALFMIFLMGCVIQKDIVKPIEQPIPSTPIQLSNKELCEQQGKVYYSGLSEGCFDKQTIEQCKNGGGEWKLFNNGCVDSCGQKPRLCTLAFAWGCDCGATKCYGNLPCNAPEGQSCVMQERPLCINDPYEPYATEQEACEATNGIWQKVGIRCPTIKEVRIINDIKVETCPVQEEDIISCQCPEGEIFYLDGCNPPKPDLMSIIAYG